MHYISIIIFKWIILGGKYTHNYHQVKLSEGGVSSTHVRRIQLLISRQLYVFNRINNQTNDFNITQRERGDFSVVSPRYTLNTFIPIARHNPREAMMSLVVCLPFNYTFEGVFFTLSVSNFTLNPY